MSTGSPSLRSGMVTSDPSDRRPAPADPVTGPARRRCRRTGLVLRSDPRLRRNGAGSKSSMPGGRRPQGPGRTNLGSHRLPHRNGPVLHSRRAAVHRARARFPWRRTRGAAACGRSVRVWGRPCRGTPEKSLRVGRSCNSRGNWLVKAGEGTNPIGNPAADTGVGTDVRHGVVAREQEDEMSTAQAKRSTGTTREIEGRDSVGLYLDEIARTSTPRPRSSCPRRSRRACSPSTSSTPAAWAGARGAPR
jgi:hypothetical protein